MTTPAEDVRRAASCSFWQGEAAKIGADRDAVRRDRDRLRRVLRLQYDNCRAVVGDTDTVNDRSCGMCAALRRMRDEIRAALWGEEPPRAKKPRRKP